MSNPRTPIRLDEWTLDLLIKQVTEGLSREELRVLESRAGIEVSSCLRDLEKAVAAMTVAEFLRRPDVAPLRLLARIEADANVYFGGVEVGIARRSGDLHALQRSPASRRGMAGWWAAAASLLLAIYGWRHSQQSFEGSTLAREPVSVAQATSMEALVPSLSEQRRSLRGQIESIRVNLHATQDPAAVGVSADVVWNSATQQGFLHFVGLRPNDARMQQYQAWIFDGERDKRYPVDAGVFDVAANTGEVIVPIRSALPIRFAKAFAVTVEKPGGVVVSALHHVVALGSAS